MKKIIFINIIILFFVLIIMEVISYNYILSRNADAIVTFNHIVGNKEIKPHMHYEKVTQNDISRLQEDAFRRVEYRDKSKKPIILFGCSFTEGFGLNVDETFSRKLADYTNRTVFNRGQSGTGIPFMYYQLSNKEVLNKLPNNAEYIIYTLIPDHFPRMFRYRNFFLSGEHTLKYKIKDNKLIRDKLLFPPIHSLFTSILIEEYIANKRFYETDKMETLFYKYFYESYNIIHEYFKDAKFIILYYKNPFDVNTDGFDEIIKKVGNIDKNNIKIIYINDLIPELYERQYWIEDNEHPSGAAWDKIIPVLDRELELNKK